MRLGFACPYYGGTPPQVVASQLSAVMHVAWQHPWVATVVTERTPHIPACEKIVERALKHETLDALFWTEHDCVLPIDAVTKLVKILENHPEADIATGITFMRYRPYHPMVAHYAGKVTREIFEQQQLSVLKLTPEDIGKDHFRFHTSIDTTADPFYVDATSMNCLLLRRRALELIASIPHPFDTDHCSTPDFALCARLMGRAKIIVDPSLLTDHLGDPPRIGFDSWVEEMEKLIRDGQAERIPGMKPGTEETLRRLGLPWRVEVERKDGSAA